MVESDEEGCDTEDKGEGTTEVNAFQLVEPVRVITGRKPESEGNGDNGEDCDGDLK